MEQTQAPTTPRFEASPEEWENPAWQLSHRYSTSQELSQVLKLSPDEQKALNQASGRLAISVTPYFLSLINSDDPQDPLRLQVIPRMAELTHSQREEQDPLHEQKHMVVPGLVHRYPDRVLIIATDRCASYCRYCTRARLVSGGQGKQSLKTDWSAIYQYLRDHQEVRDVLISGGDPLLFSNTKLRGILEQLRAIKHIEFLRLGTRVPIFLPQRIDKKLCEMLREYAPLFISVHCNHAQELSERCKQALDLLADHGIPLGSQSVLLRGVNDTIESQRALYHRLLQCRVRPYYLYQCDLMEGTAHFRTSVERGLDIMDGLRGYTSGYALPHYVLDAPGGGGKIHLNRQTIVGERGGELELRNYLGERYWYPKG